jgi:adenylate cyclase, class 2
MTTQNNQELEVKFYISDLGALEEKLRQAGALLKQGRVFEANLRFDTPTGELARTARVLRLRRDERLRLTYKGPSDLGQGVTSRPEIEFEVSSFENAQAFLEALGYVVSVRYDKYRTTYLLGEVEVTLDELPYGNFAEIEAPGAEVIQSTAAQLSLTWEARCMESYLALFGRLLASQAITARHLTFEEVRQKFPAEVFGLRPADS